MKWSPVNIFGRAFRVLSSALALSLLPPIAVATAFPATISSAISTREFKAVPANKKAPVISGTLRVPNQLSVSNGTWTGAPTAFTFQWLRCSKKIAKAVATKPTQCSEISGATSSTYTLTDNDASQFIIARVGGSNTSGGKTIFTPAATSITPRVIVPKNTVAPVISGTAQVSRVLTVSNGTWIESPEEYSYQWYRCTNQFLKAVSKRPRDCVAIFGAAEATYQLSHADKKKFITAAITGQNAAGDSVIYVRSTKSVVTPKPYAPSAVHSPSLEGVSLVGEVLNLEGGAYTGYPIPSVAISWHVCPSNVTITVENIGSTCEERGTSGELDYEISAEDLGYHVTALIDVSNEIGQIWSIVKSLSVASSPPTLLSAPNASGHRYEGAILTADLGNWMGYPNLAFSRQWIRCSEPISLHPTLLPEGCQEIEGQTSETYELTSSDIGKYVSVRITGENPLGTASTIANTNEIVGSIPSLDTGVFTVDGEPTTGNELTLSVMDWNGSPSPNFEYEWYKCQNESQLSVVVPPDCSEIPGESGETLDLDWRYSGYFLGNRVTATNVHGSESVFITSQSVVRPPVTVISSGYRHTCARTESINLVCWGLNNTKQVGSDAATVVNSPTQVALNGPVREVSVGYYHSCVLTTNVWCWGDNFWGSLGNGSQVSSTVPVESPTPNVLGVVSGSDTVCAIDSSPKAVCWGRSDYGQVGNRETTSKIPNPTVHSGSAGVQSIDVGYLHTCFVVSGLVYCVGYDGLGALGDSASHTGQYSLNAVRAGTLTNMVGVSAGYGHSCAWGGEQSRVYCWGDHSKSQLGIPSGNRTTPGADVGLVNVVKVETRYESTCALTSKGLVYCWGANTYGQLGNGNVSNADSPQQVFGIQNAFDISVGEHFACAAIAGGQVKCWGRNNQGQISDSGMDVLTPLGIENLESVG